MASSQTVQVVDFQLRAGAELEPPKAECGELGLYVTSGQRSVGDRVIAVNEYGVLGECKVRAASTTPGRW